MPTIYNKRGTQYSLSVVNPILGSGELCLETDTNRIKFGNGTNNWNDLPYAILPSGTSNGQFLQYNNGSGLWIPTSSGNFTSLSVNNIDVSVSGHYHMPRVVTLTYGATLNTDANTGDIFDVTLTGNTILANPTNPTNGQTIRWRITQDSSGGRGVTLGSKFAIPSTATSPLPVSTGSGMMDILGATYHLTRDKWDIIAFVPGY